MSAINWHFSEAHQGWYWSDDSGLSWYSWESRNTPDGSTPPVRQPLVWQPLWDALDSRPTEWIETTEGMFWEMLEVVPPRAQVRGAFLVGEAQRHNSEGKAVYAAFKESGDRYYAKHLTVEEFNAEFKNP